MEEYRKKNEQPEEKKGEQKPAGLTEATKIPEKKIRDFESQSLEHVTRGWIDQLQKNEKEFSSAVADLQMYELAFVRSLADIETVQVKTSEIKKAYTSNVQELDDIAAA